MHKTIPALALLLAPTVAFAADIRGDRSTTTVTAASWQNQWLKGEPAGYGVFEAAGDRDWFRIDLAAGQDYAFIDGPIDGEGVGIGDVFNTLRILDASGKPVPVGPCTPGDETCGSEFRVTRTGTYFVEVAVANPPRYIVPGDTTPPPWNYWFQVGPDCRADRTTTCALKPGATRQDRSAWGGDDDWFRVGLRKGHAYGWRLDCGSPGNQIPWLAVMSADGRKELAEGSDGDRTSVSAIAAFRPPATGTYFVAANCSDDDGDGSPYALAMTGR